MAAIHSASRRNWSERELEILCSNYGLLPPEQIAKEISRRCGTRRSRVSVLIMANRHGVDSRFAPGLFSVREVALDLSITRNIIYGCINRGKIKATGDGKNRFLDVAAVETLRKLYPPPPKRHTTRQELMRRLGYSCCHSCRLLDCGIIKGVKRGAVWYVDADHLDEFEAEMRRSGCTRLSLSGSEPMKRHRARCKNYYPGRKERRRVARSTTWMTFTEAQTALSVPRKVLKAKLESGEIPGRRENDLWLVLRSHVESLLQKGES